MRNESRGASVLNWPTTSCHSLNHSAEKAHPQEGNGWVQSGVDSGKIKLYSLAICHWDCRRNRRGVLSSVDTPSPPHTRHFTPAPLVCCRNVKIYNAEMGYFGSQSARHSTVPFYNLQWNMAICLDLGTLRCRQYRRRIDQLLCEI